MINDYINNNGSKKYTFITLMIEKTEYISASIILSESFKEVGTKADLVIIVNDWISKEDEILLKRFYNKIIKIKVMKIDHENERQNIIINKLEGLNLVEYEKICLIDIDTIIFENLDYIFYENSPTSLYINNKINSGLLILNPDKEFYKKIKNKLSEKKYLDILKKEDKPLIYILKYFYKNINKLTKKVININKYEKGFSIMYSNEKPFIMKNKENLEERSKLEINRIWYYFFIKIINKYPEIKDNESLKETIEISKYFMHENFKKIVDYKDLNKKDIDKIMYDLYNLKDKNNSYYHLDISKEYDNDSLNFLDNIFILNNFREYLKNRNLINSNVKINNINDVISNVSDENILEYLLNEYVKVKKNIIVGLIIDKEEINIKNIPKKNLFYKKNFKLLGFVLKNILFNINQDYTYDQRLEQLSKFFDYETYNVLLCIYETIYSINFFDLNKDNTILINNNNTKIRAASILLNKNTLSRYTNKKIKLIENNKIDKINLLKLLKFQTIKKWIYNNYDGNELKEIIIYKLDNKLILIDNIIKNKERMKIIKDDKIKLLDLYFNKLDKNNRYEKIIENINNPEFYWELEGIKFVK